MSSENISHTETREPNVEQVKQPDIESSATKVKILREETSRLLFNDPSYTSFDAMRQMSLGTFEVLCDVERKIRNKSNNTAIFVFGSPSRFEMLPNSDLDVGIISLGEKPEDQENSDVLKVNIESLPFEKVEIANWSSPESMLIYSETSLVEGNQAIDARYVAGNTTPLRQYFEFGIDRENHSIERKLTNFFWEKKFLHTFDYPKKHGENGANLKYEQGASRDLIFVDWYMDICRELGDTFVIDPDRPQLEQALENIPSSYDKNEVVSGINLINTIKTMGVSLFNSSRDKRFLSNSQALFDACFSNYSDKLSGFGCENCADLIVAYNDAQRLIIGLVNHLETIVQSRMQSLFGEEWTRSYIKAKSAISNENDYLEKIKQFNQTEDRIIRNTNLWGLVEYAHTSNLANYLVTPALDRINIQWEDIGTILTNQSLDDNSLFRIAGRLVNKPGYEYLLRLIIKHPNAGPETLSLVGQSPLLDSKYRVKK